MIVGDKTIMSIDKTVMGKENVVSLSDATKDKGLKMMSIGLHPRIIGRPGRINGLKKILRM